MSQDPIASESRSHSAGESPDGPSTGALGAGRRRMRRKVPRTRTGCARCKSRRKRCDMSRPCCGDCTRLNLECEWPAVKRISKTTDGTARTLSPRVGTVYVPEEQGLSSGETSHPGSSVPEPSRDSNSTPTVSPGWSHTRADGVPQDLFGGNPSPPQFNPIDDVILQLWAETCAPFLSDDAVQAVSSGHRPSALPLPPTARVCESMPNTSDTISSMPGGPSSTLPDGTTQAQILHYFRDRLASLLSYDEVLFPNAFHAFNATASANIGDSAGRALHYGILALASRYMFNKGQLCYERISEQLGVEGSAIILQRLKDIPKLEEVAEEESITLLAGLLMFVMYKICRGDVWGFESYFTQLKRLCAALFTRGQAPKGLSNTKFSLYGCSLYAQGPAIDPEVSTAYANTQRGIPHALTGLALPLYCILPRIAKLVNQSWAHSSAIWTDQELVEIVSKAENLEATLEKERIWLENFVRDRPDMASHRYFHDAFRIACLLQIKCFILCLPPDALSVRLLVRNALSLLETMELLNLPGFVSSHWIIFTVSICSTSSNDNRSDTSHTDRGGSSKSISDRQRAGKLYASAIQIVQSLWDQSQGGRLSIHWLSILADLDWEIIFA
ncbi:fungal-specific transcription factor domain-containing protein [Trichoderma compactum]